ncbi:MAG TPA: phosphotransferase [Acidimicrobiia bacterium]|nr:phosphotransferase [Acidimicrobiia bacterium]
MLEFPRQRLADLLGHEPRGWVRRGGGYTDAGRWVVELAQNRLVFVKAASGPGAEAVRREASVLGSLSGFFHPRLLAFGDEADLAIEVIEDLSSALWPPPYPEEVNALFDALDELEDHDPPLGLRELQRPSEPVWPLLGADRGWLQNQAVCTDAWLDASIDAVASAEEEFDPSGNRLVHNDLWSGNIAFVGRRCLFIDWAEAHRGSHWVDMGFAMLSLRSEGDPAQIRAFPGDAAFACWWSAQLIRRLTDGVEPWLDATIVEGLRQDLAAVLAWASELLDLPTPGHE